MASYDNEIYRGPPEAGPTLEHDIRSYGSDVYIVKSEITTLKQDAPPTKEPIRQESKPVQKKESKIAKAMKLLASCTAAIAVAATLSAPAPAKPVDNGLAVWPWFGPVIDGNYSFDAISQNSNVCQVSIGAKNFRLEALKEGLHLQWHDSFNISSDGSNGAFTVCMESTVEDWNMILNFSVTPQQKQEDTEGLTQLTSTTGDTLYVRGFHIGHHKGSERSAQEILDNLNSYIRVTKPTNDGWGKVLIGETMYSDVNDRWNGLFSVIPWEDSRPYNSTVVDRFLYKENAGYSPDNLVCQHRVNGIDWSFYISLRDQSLFLWSVPSHEDIAFGSWVDEFLYEVGIDPAQLKEMYGDQADDVTAELLVALRPTLLDYIEHYLIPEGLQYYHLIDRPTQNAPAEAVQQLPIAAGWNTSRNYPNFYSIQPGYENHGTCLFSAGDTVYLASPLKEDHYLLWLESNCSTQPAEYGYDEPYEYRTATILLYNARDQWQAELVFLLQPPDEGSGLSTMATYEASDGQLFYLVAINCTDEDLTRERYREIESIADNLSALLRIQVMNSGSWAHLQLGDHLLSNITPAWTGLSTVKHADYSGYRGVDMNWNIEQIRYTNSIDFQSLQSQRSQEINGITWSFYTPANSPDFGYDEDYLWAVPSHGDMSFGINIHGILRSMFGDGDYLWNALQENPYLVTDSIPEIIDMIIEDGLIHIHPIGTAEKPEPENPNADKYFHAAEFSLGGRSFRMDSMQDDVSIRHFYTGPEESEEFDLWFAGDDTHVQLVLSTDPEGKEFYEYAYPGFDPVYYALYSWSDHPMSASELDTLAYEIPNYINLTELTPAPETTAPPETTVPEPTLPEPYPEMEEYIQYYVSYDTGLHHTELARSNRVCQFVTDRGNYRLRAKVPEIFVCTEDYYYDVKEEMSNSRISISHYEEGWRMEAWVFNEPVDSVYQGFSMIAEDGSELWFYVSELGEEYDLFSIIGRLSNLVTLSTANDDDWGKVRIGETLISHNNQYWNGTAYTVGSYDFWYFEQILDSHALSGYDLQHAGQRVVNGITWDFYTLGNPSGYPNSDGLDYYFTEVYVVCGQEDIWLKTSLSYGLSPSNSQFASQAEYEANLDWEMGFAIDTIVRTGLSNYHPYP